MKDLRRWLHDDDSTLDRDRRREDTPERGRYGVARRDVWSFDRYLALVISNGLTELRDQEAGVPCSVVAGEDFDEPLTAKTWDAILEAIVDGFGSYANSYLPEWDRRAFDRGMCLFTQWFGVFWN